VLLTLVRVALGFTLLSDISFTPTYQTTQEFEVTQAGLSPMNASLANASWFQDVAIDFFWLNFPSLLSDGKISYAVAPATCSGTSCQSFFLPGPTSVIQFDPNSPNITDSLSPEASVFMQYNAPGYQFDFSPIEEGTDPPILETDCHLYGLEGLALQICLKQSNSSIIAGKPL
jgi:hypothetical protein